MVEKLENKIPKNVERVENLIQKKVEKVENNIPKKVDGLPLNEFRVLGEKCSARWNFALFIKKMSKIHFQFQNEYVFFK